MMQYQCPTYFVPRILPTTCSVQLFFTFCSTVLLQVLGWTPEPSQGYFRLQTVVLRLFLWGDEGWCLTLPSC